MRTRNGWTDDGSRIGNKENCPNCGSPQYYQTVSREHCPACGLVCDYWGDGTNDVYKRMMEERQHREDMARWEEEDRDE